MAVYEATARYLVPSVLDGYNATVFAYGQTVSLKRLELLQGRGGCGFGFFADEKMR